MQINTEFYEHLNEEKAGKIIEKLRNDEVNFKPGGSRWADKFF
jgi:hypothetical protein